jgi:ABC-type Fe3+ transport system permease subunit
MHFLSQLPNEAKVAILVVLLVAAVAGILMLQMRFSRSRQNERRRPG